MLKLPKTEDARVLPLGKFRYALTSWRDGDVHVELTTRGTGSILGAVVP